MNSMISTLQPCNVFYLPCNPATPLNIPVTRKPERFKSPSAAGKKLAEKLVVLETQTPARRR